MWWFRILGRNIKAGNLHPPVPFLLSLRSKSSGRPRASGSLAAACMLLVAASCGKPSEIPIIASPSEYTDVLQRAEKLSREPLEKYERDEELTESDKKQLGEALKMFEGLVAFLPENFGAYFGSAKIHQALGEKETALARYGGFVELAPKSPTPEVRALLAESHFSIAEIFESLGEFDMVERNAEAAVGHVRQNADYLAMLASVRLRQKREEEAHKLVDEALALDPQNGRARQLHSMIGHAHDEP
jgi:tetratricopeptide (TPR) repeat protein